MRSGPASLHGVLTGVWACAVWAVAALAWMNEAQAVSPRQLVEVVDISDPVVSPDGRHVAFRVLQPTVVRNTIGSTWFVQAVDGGTPPRRVGEGGFARHAYWGLPAPEPATWSPDGRWIYYRAVIDGRVDVWRAAADGSGNEPLTLDAADVRDFSLDASGGELRYSVGATREQVERAEQAEYDTGVRIDKAAPIGQPLFRSGVIDGRPATQRYRDGHELDRVRLLDDVADRWTAIDLVTGQRRALSADEVPRATMPPPLSGTEKPLDWQADPHGGHVAVLTPAGPGDGMYRQPYAALSVVPAGGRRSPVVCDAAPCVDQAITSLQWRPGRGEVVFTVTDPEAGLAQSIFRWDIDSGVVHPVIQSNGLVNGGRDERSVCGIATQALICVAAEADRPPRLERIDLDTGARLVLFEPNAALESQLAVSARLLRWQDAAGQVFTGQFYAARAAEGRPPPLFVNYYRCSGFLRGGTGDEWPMASLAEQGIAVLCINYAPLRLDAEERYGQGLSAVRSAVESLAVAGEIDRYRVGMGGLSLGTEVTLWTVANSDLLAAASISSTVPSPLAYQMRAMYDDTFLPGLRKFWQLDAIEDTPERWRRLSLAFNLDAVDTPILMQLPEQEYLLSLDWAVPLIKSHRAEMHVFADEAHFKFQPRHKLAVYERNLDWFRYWLLDREDPHPAKQNQFARWRLMRERIPR